MVALHAAPTGLVGALVLVTGLISCATDRTLQGECQDAYGGDICTWGTVSGGGVFEFGATVPLQSVESAPTEGEMVWPPPELAVLQLPEEVKSYTGFDHLLVNWEVHGHPPPPFLPPHFDFHFYTVSRQEREAIDCADSAKSDQLPAGYALPDVTIPEIGELIGLCVPAMGMHALRQEELDSPDPFSATMVVGYYRGDVIFVEPMITRATLLEEQGFPLTVPMLPGEEGVRYPTQFQAEYDSTARAYRLVFSGFDG